MPEAIVESLQGSIGLEVAVSDWLTIDQCMIDGFAEVTGDRQFIHVDPLKAAQTLFGGTIAHGFLMLAILPRFTEASLPRAAQWVHGINYGFDRVRFLNPVRSGARVRARFVLSEVALRKDRQVMSRYGVTVDIEGQERAALVADWLVIDVYGG